MARETVSDIIGKGLKFENRVIVDTLPSEKLEGTIPAFIGGAHWGQLNTPTLVKKSFKSYFGDPVVAVDENDNRALDFSGLAAEYHLRYSQLCYFTRISDGTDKAASRILKKDAKVAKLSGAATIQNSVATIFPKSMATGYKNNLFVLKKDGVVKAVEVEPSPSASALVDISNVNVASIVGKNIMFSIDGNLVMYKVLGTESNIVDALAGALATKLGISLGEAQTLIYTLKINEIALTGITFENGDIIFIDGGFQQFNGTAWVAITKTDVTVLPQVNPADNGYVYNSTAHIAYQFHSAGSGSYTFLAMFATPEGPTVPITFGFSGDVYHLTAADGGLQPGLIQSNGTDTWSQLCLEAELRILTADPVVTTEGYYYNTVSKVLSFFTYATNTFETIAYDTINYVVFKSRNYGKQSSVEIHDFPGTIYNENNTLSVIGQDSPINGVVQSIFDKIKNAQTAVVPGDVGLYLKSGGTWGTALAGTVMYGARPTTPADGTLWKSDGSETGYAFGWFRYDAATTSWISLDYVQFGTEKPANSVGADGDYFEVINVPAISDVTIGFDEFGRFMIVSNSAGAAQTLCVPSVNGNYSIYDVLCLDNTVLNVVFAGSDEALGGKIEATSTGELGNQIFLLLDEGERGQSLEIYLGNSRIASFYNFSYVVADTNFIGTMINNDLFASKYVKLTPEPGVASIPEFEPRKALYLSGGTSGLNNIEDFMYIAAANEYKNIDLYDIDIIAVPGVVSEAVVDALDAVCKYRKDCFVIADPPQSMSPYLVEKWHNGQSDIRTKKLDSEFVSLYYPWILIPVNSNVLPKQWAPPSVRVIGTIGNCDLLNQNKFSPVAGYRNGKIFDIEALELYLTEEEKGRLYEDRLGNNINPIVYNKNQGYFIDGNKTTKRGATPVNRLTVVRTALYIKRRVTEIAPNYFWLPVTPRTRANFADELDSIMAPLAESNVIKPGYIVNVDDILNDVYVEAQRGMIAMIEWQPVNRLEKIKIINTIRGQEVAFEIQF